MKGRKFFVSTLLVLSSFMAVMGLADTDPTGHRGWLERLKDFDLKKILKITADENTTKDVAGLSAFISATGKGTITQGWATFTTASLTDVASPWDGVTLENDRVTKIELSGKGLTGNLSAVSTEFNDLTELTKIDLSINSLTGIPSFKAFTKLEILKLDSNKLTGLVPTDLGDLSSLTTLDLSKNNFDSIPADLVTKWESSKLTKLDLRNNKFDFGDLEQLAKLIEKKVVTYSDPSIKNDPATDALEVDEADDLYYAISEPNGSRNIYKWYLNGDATPYVTQKDSADLSIKLISDLDSGTWVLKVSNEVITGVEIEYFTLKVTVKPCIVTGVDAVLDTAAGANRNQKYLLTVCQSDTLVLPTIYGNQGSVKGNNIAYQWQRAAKDSSTWTNVDDKINYKATNISDTTLFRLIVSSDLCDPDTSTIVKINYIAKLDSNTILTKEQTICKSDTVPTLVGSLPTGGGGQSSYLYQWQSRTSSDTAWINQGQSQNYTPISLTDTTRFRRVVTSKKGCELSDTSAIVQVNIFPDVQSNAMSADQEICPGGNALVLRDTTFNLDTLAWDEKNFTYAWQKSTDKITWSRADSTFNTDSFPEFTPRNVLRETYYRRVVQGTGLGLNCVVDTSNIVTISMFPEIRNNVVDANKTTLCERYEETLKTIDGLDSLVMRNADTVTLAGSAPTGGGGNYSYIWQTSLDSLNWSDRGTTDTLLLNDMDFTDTLTYIRRVVQSKCYYDTSNVIQIEKIFNFGENQIGTSQLLCVGTDPDTLQGNPQTTKGNFRFEWQVSTDSLNWKSVGIDSIANQQNLGLDSLDAGYYYYRRAVFGGCLPNYSNVVTLEIAPEISNNTIAGSQEICEGDTVALIQATKVTGGGGGYYYEWYSSTDTISRSAPDSASWVKADTSEFMQPDRLTRTTFYRRLAYANRCDPDTSNVVEVKVYNVIEDNKIGNNQRACEGDTLNILVGSTPTGGDADAADSVAWSYVWQFKATESDDDWASIGNKKDYQPESNLKKSTSFRRIVTIATAGGRNCFENVSDSVTITIIPKIQSNNIGGDQVICEYYEGYQDYIAPDTLTGSKPVGGGKVIEFQWQKTTDMQDTWVADDGSTTDASWENISSAKDTSYVPFPYPTVPTRYRRIVFSESVNGASCFQDTSSAVIIDVIPLRFITIGQQITADSLITEGIEIEIGEEVELNASGANTYLWYEGTGRLDETTLIESRSSRVTVSPTVTKTYTIIGVYSQGCKSEPTTVQVRVNQDPKFLKVSEVITPNDDGLNDNLYIKGIEKFPYNKVHIFNRWGVKLMEIRNYKNDNPISWKGKMPQKTQPEDTDSAFEEDFYTTDEVPAGVYFYMIEFFTVRERTRTVNGEERTYKSVVKATDRVKKGTVTIIR